MYCNFFRDRSILSLFIKVRCGSCGRLVTVNLRDKCCPICRRKLYK